MTGQLRRKVAPYCGWLQNEPMLAQLSYGACMPVPASESVHWIENDGGVAGVVSWLWPSSCP